MKTLLFMLGCFYLIVCSYVQAIDWDKCESRGCPFVRSLLCGQRVQGSKHDSTEVPPSMGHVDVKSYIVAKRPPVGVSWKFGEGVPAQASSLSSDRGSKLRGLSQNSPRVA
ncbi:hypothetical protein AVEN_226915-1 [Araneus ventricosus]|uniref:Uncharacterized protein n=1 Tax=Araneus ventricosus TaxID=182803 RepID=A0A4Y2W0M9_ARAVE|nr:hypothetical protein AVEN_226915-1 [Araneus ventricosus]